MTYKNIKKEKDYKKLLRSGMLLQFHPELTGNWEMDKEVIDPSKKACVHCKKTKIMKPLRVLEKGVIVDYQTVIEEIIGMWLSELSCYDPNWDRKTHINGTEIEKDRAYFVPDADYELIVRRKQIKKVTL